MAIYKEVLNWANHPSAEVIYKNLRDVHPNISFDTVNRTLLTLAEMELMQIVEGSGDARRFDRINPILLADLASPKGHPALVFFISLCFPLGKWSI